MLKNDKQIKRIQRKVNNLNLDLQAIIEEHDRYIPKASDEAIAKWFDSLPIETLKESLDREKHRPREKYSLHDMKHKFALRKLYNQKQIELEKEEQKLNLAKIEYLLDKINGIKAE